MLLTSPCVKSTGHALEVSAQLNWGRCCLTISSAQREATFNRALWERPNTCSELSRDQVYKTLLWESLFVLENQHSAVIVGQLPWEAVTQLAWSLHDPAAEFALLGHPRGQAVRPTGRVGAKDVTAGQNTNKQTLWVICAGNYCKISTYLRGISCSEIVLPGWGKGTSILENIQDLLAIPSCAGHWYYPSPAAVPTLLHLLLQLSGTAWWRARRKQLSSRWNAAAALM